MNETNHVASDAVELDLTQVGDLHLFADSVAELWSEIERYRELLPAEEVRDLLAQARTAHDELGPLVERRQACISNACEIEGGSIERLQELYSQLDAIEVELRTRWEEYAPTSQAPHESPGPENGGEEREDGEIESVVEGVSRDEVDGSLEQTEESGHESDSGAFDVKEVIGTVHRLVEEVEELRTTYPRNNSTTLYLDEVAITQDRLRRLLSALTGRVTLADSYTEQEVRRVKEVATEAERNIAVVRQLLREKASHGEENDGGQAAVDLPAEQPNIVQDKEVVTEVADVTDWVNEAVSVPQLLPEALRRKKLAVVGDEHEWHDKPVTITVDLAPAARKLSAGGSGLFGAQLVGPSENSSLISQLENRDPINSVAAGHAGSSRWHGRKTAFSAVVAEALKDPEYAKFVHERYSSTKVFSEAVRMFVLREEERLQDPIDRWIGNSNTSCFTYLFRHTVADVVSMSRQKDLRKNLDAAEVSYEAFLLWLERALEAVEELGLSDSVGFGQAIVVWFLEMEMQRYGG